MTKSFFSWHFSIFWNAFYLFKIGLCFWGFIGFSYVLNPLAFIFCGLHFRKKWLENFRSLIVCFLSFALLYHDSFLPSMEQLWTQRANVAQFSLSYVVEFLTDFINPAMLVAIPICFIAIFVISKAIRGCALVFLGFITLFFIEGSSIAQLTKPQDDVIVGERFLKERVLDEEGMLTQRGSFTRGNLSAYEKQFYDNEALRQVTFSKAKSLPFSIILLSVDGMSNNDLARLNVKSHAVLKRFDIRFNNFNTVSVSEPELSLRLLSAVCGQRHSDSLINDHKLNAKCSLPKALANIGLGSYLLFDEDKQYESVLAYADDFALDAKALQKVVSDSSTRMQFDNALKLLRQNNAKFLYMRFSKSVAFDNKAIAMSDFLSNLNVFLDRLDASGIRSLIVLLPGIGGNSSDIKLQLGHEIPSDIRCLGSVYLRFSSMPHESESYEVVPNVSYLALTEFISRALASDPYAESTVHSIQALTDELPRTAVLGEDQGTRFMLFRNRRFCVPSGEDNAWTSFEK